VQPDQIRPLNDQLLVKRLETVTRTEGGLFLPENRIAKNIECEVLASGPGARNKSGQFTPNAAQAGDIVIVRTWSGTLLDEVRYPEVSFIKNEVIEALVTKQ